MTEPELWDQFLRARKAIILQWKSEGMSDIAIVHLLTCDVKEVQQIYHVEHDRRSLIDSQRRAS